MCFLDFCLEKLSDKSLESLCGLHRSTFLYIYYKYCVGSNVIPTRVHLFRIFAYLKLYPTTRTTRTFLVTYLLSIQRGVNYLASVMNEMITPWQARNKMSNRTNHRFANNVIGCVDTFPIVVNRPKKDQSLLYNGKYKQHIYKVTAIALKNTIFACLYMVYAYVCVLFFRFKQFVYIQVHIVTSRGLILV